MKILKKAEMGMGTLIIFIALVLVAAVAAAVLVSTTASLQNKALSTGKEAKKEVGTSMTTIQIYAEDGSTDERVSEYYQLVKLTAGSDSMRFSDLLITLNLKNQSSDYEYDSSIDCLDSSTTVPGVDFGVMYSINGSNHKAGYLVKGDVAKICFEAPRNVTESEAIRLNLIPKVGTPHVIVVDMPGLMVDQRVEVFP